MTFGSPVDPKMVPSGPALAPSVVPVTLDAYNPPVNLPVGVSPKLNNWLLTPEGMSPRWGFHYVGSASGLSSSQSWLASAAVGFMAEWQSANPDGQQTSVLVFSALTVLRWHQDQYWAQLSYGTNNVNDPPSKAPSDAVVIYDPVSDDNALVFTNDADRPFIYAGPNTAASATTFSTLTNAEPARCVTSWDNRVIFGAVTSGGTKYLQRVQWTERGNPSVITEPTGGFEELSDMRGGIVKMVPDGDRFVIFSDMEIWAGYKAPFPFDIRFEPLDRTVGCIDAFSVQRTPAGTVFQGHDSNVYLLPKGASQAIPIGDRVWPDIRKRQGILQATTHGTSLYDTARGQYALLPAEAPAAGGVVSTSPRKGFVLDLRSQRWSAVSYLHPISAAVMLAKEVNNQGPIAWYGTSGGTVMRSPKPTTISSNASSNATNDLGSNYSAYAFFPLGNENPAQKQLVHSLIIDYSNFTCGSGSSITIACSDDFGQTSGFSVGVALPQAFFSRQTVVNLQYAAFYPSIEVRYESQKSGHDLMIQRLTAMVGPIGQPGTGG